MSIQAIDLGSVIGPAGATGAQGQQGPRGPSGIATTSGVPSSSEGSDGDIRIDPANGDLYLKQSGEWTKVCRLQVRTTGSAALTMNTREDGTEGTWTNSACTVSRVNDVVQVSIRIEIGEGWVYDADAGAEDNVICTIPEGFRPTSDTFVAIRSANGLGAAADNMIGIAYIETNGDVSVHLVVSVVDGWLKPVVQRRLECLFLEATYLKG